MNKHFINNRKLKLLQILKLFESKKIDINETSIKINNLYQTPIIVKCYHDENVSVSGILANNKFIKFNHRIFKFIEDNKEDTLKWLSNWNTYKLTGEEDKNEPLSTYRAYSIEINNKGENIILKFDISMVDEEFSDLYPFFIRLTQFNNLLRNIEFINKRISNYFKLDSADVEDS